MTNEAILSAPLTVTVDASPEVVIGGDGGTVVVPHRIGDRIMRDGKCYEVYALKPDGTPVAYPLAVVAALHVRASAERARPKNRRERRAAAARERRHG